MRCYLLFALALAMLVLSCEDGTRRIFPNDNSAVGDKDVVAMTDDDSLLPADSDDLLPDGAVVTDDGAVVTDDGAVVTDDGVVVTDDGVVVTDDGVVVTDDGVVVPDVDNAPCSSGDTRQIACGLNGEGLQPQACVGGNWQNSGDCDDDDVCVNGTSQDIDCGLNDRGTQAQDCTGGQWVNDGACDDPDECVDNTPQQIDCTAGDKTGKQDQKCIEGTWTNEGGCAVPGRWDCAGTFMSKNCTPVYGDAACGNGTCSPNTGESPQSCPADCGALVTQDGQGKACNDEIDCAFYLWTANGVGYWECKAVTGQDYCNAVVDDVYCGTATLDYCYYGSIGIETPATCAVDCANKPIGQGNTDMQCDNDSDCIFLDWPEQ